MSHQPRKFTDTQTFTFIIILSLVCALILSILASALAKPKEVAKELDRSKQMMIAARILTHEGYFILPDEKGKYVPAKYENNGVLVPSTDKIIATSAELLEVFKKRLVPLFVNSKGEEISLEKSNIDLNTYLNDFRKSGYYKEPLKLLYKIMPNKQTAEEKPIGYVIPVNGYGLWDAIYGYIAVKPDGDTVIGISWYDQKETPGLGADIATENWQKQFPGKKIFQESPSGTTDFKTAPLGITVVKGYVADVLGSAPKAKSAVDGMAGATLTGNGVTDAYRDVLSGYRPFLISLNKQYNANKGES